MSDKLTTMIAAAEKACEDLHRLSDAADKSTDFYHSGCVNSDAVDDVWRELRKSIDAAKAGAQ